MQQIALEQYKLPYKINEEIKLLRTNLQFCGVDKKVVLVTSAMSGEGKSTLVLNLCRSLTELGKKVLLIDADLRKSILKKKITSGKVHKGLTHYLSGQCGADEIVYQSDTEGLSVIFSGAVPPNPSELLSDRCLEELLQKMRSQYDYIMIDSPPLGLVVDAAVIAPRCDGVVLTISAGEIKYRLAQEVVSKLQNTQCPILGVVLNKVDRRKDSRYYSKYYGRYYGKRYEKYYGDADTD